MRRVLLVALVPFALFACDDTDDTTAQSATDASVGMDAAPTADIGPEADAGALADMAAPDAELPDAEPDAEPRAVDERGAWSVGFHTETIEYTDPTGEQRPLDLHWWYPTSDAAEGSVRYAGIHLRQGIAGDGAPALDEPAPLLVFSHGNGGFAEQSFFFTEHMASHGWVVLAMDHTGNTLRGGRPTHEMFDLRPLDVRATLDYVDALPDDHLLAGGIGPQRALSGHSFGGYTTLAVGGARYDVDAMLAACEAAEPGEMDDACTYLAEAEPRFRAGFADPRLQALIPMTPAGATLFGAGLGEITAPTLLMTAERDATLPDAVEGDPIWAALGDSAVRLSFPDAGHFTFSDACVILPGTLEDDGCGETFLEPTEAHRLINGYALAFLRWHVLGDDRDADLLDGARSLGPGAVLLQK